MTTPPVINYGFSAAERAAIIAARNRAHSGTPSLVRKAFLTAPVTIDKITIRPVTLSDWLALEELKHPWITPRAESDESAVTSAAKADALLVFVLTHTPDTIRRLIQSSEFDVQSAAFILSLSVPILSTLITHARAALLVAVSTQPASGRQRARTGFAAIPQKSSGLGWTLQMADALAHEYGWSDAFIWDELPLAKAFAYHTAIMARYSDKPSGPSYADREISAARQAARSHDHAAPSDPSAPPTAHPEPRTGNVS